MKSFLHFFRRLPAPGRQRTFSPAFRPVFLSGLLMLSCEMPPQEAAGLEIPAPRPGEKIVEYKGYVCSYNTETLIPDWVAYELTAEETFGRSTRDDKSFGMDLSFRGRQARRGLKKVTCHRKKVLTIRAAYAIIALTMGVTHPAPGVSRGPPRRKPGGKVVRNDTRRGVQTRRNLEKRRGRPP